jgi:hypothetical protein
VQARNVRKCVAFLSQFNGEFSTASVKASNGKMIMNGELRSGSSSQYLPGGNEELHNDLSQNNLSGPKIETGTYRISILPRNVTPQHSLGARKQEERKKAVRMFKKLICA